ncbi:MAG: serine/threonine protein kinase [Deltaproteobacteria bacterium]|nr:serine/threonine protein kinase [Deltaproteobacteria bacterium]
MKHGDRKDADRRIGMVIGDYTVVQKLAEGGMGAVYLATNRPTGLQVVVKFMLAEFAANEALRERFEREVRAAVRLKGKTNIVEIYSCNERDGEMYMTMEYLQGETLQDHLRRCGRISVHHAFRLIAQIIAALHELHQVGIIHRDLKPANAFVLPTDAEAYCVKLIDFGIIHDRQAVAGAQRTLDGAIVGTPGYMALEQYGDAGNVTPAADVFALAVMVWEMFTGQLPWSAVSEFALYEKTKCEPPVLPSGHYMPQGWESVIFQALRPNPKDRPPLHALLYALARAVPAEPHLPSGFDIVARYAPRVLRNTPVEVDTVRASDPQRGAVAYWALHRVTVAPQGAPVPVPASVSDGIPISAPGLPPVFASEVTANLRPAPAIAPTPAIAPVAVAPIASAPVAVGPTTLNLAAGFSHRPNVAPTRGTRGRWLVAAVAGVSAVLLLAYGIRMGMSRRGSAQVTGTAAAEAVSADAAPATADADPDSMMVTRSSSASDLSAAPDAGGRSLGIVDAGVPLSAPDAPPIDAGVADVVPVEAAPKRPTQRAKPGEKAPVVPPVQRKQPLPPDDRDAPAE